MQVELLDAMGSELAVQNLRVREGRPRGKKLDLDPEGFRAIENLAVSGAETREFQLAMNFGRWDDVTTARADTRPIDPLGEAHSGA